MPKHAICPNCGQSFFKKRELHIYCSPKCRYQYTLKQRNQKMRSVLVDKETHKEIKIRAIFQQKSMGDIVKELLIGKQL